MNAGKCLAILIAVPVTLSFGGIVAAKTSAAQTTPTTSTRPQDEGCIDESGQPFSKGALRKVDQQIQRCDGRGHWVAGSTTGEVLPVPKNKSCKAQKSQVYDAGLLRKISGKTERCDNGKWVVQK